MAHKKLFENLPTDQKDFGSKIFDLIINRIFEKAYSGLDEDKKKEMDGIFISADNKEKKKFIKKYIPNLEKLFKQEAKKIEEEIKLEIERQF